MQEPTVLDRWLVAAQEDAREVLASLVRQRSDNPPGDCAAHAELAATLLEARGLAVERLPIARDQAALAGMVSTTNLVIRHRFGDGPTLALCAHGDTVPPGQGWTVDPFAAVVRGGVMYGRGVALSKSDFVTYAWALLALRETEVLDRGTIELHLTHDAEAGGELGAAWLLRTGVSRPDMAICAGFAHAVGIAHNGCLHLEVEIRGRSAHAALPETGIDALEATTRLLDALYTHRKQLAARRSKVSGIEHATLVVGMIEGGINTNVVPDRVTLRVDRRILPEEDPEIVETGLRALIETEVGRSPGVSVRTRRVLLARPLVPAQAAEPIARLLSAEVERRTGSPAPLIGIPLYSDARHYAAAGIPVVSYGAGPREILDSGAHRADERLVLDDLLLASQVVAATALQLLAPAGAATGVRGAAAGKVNQT